MIISKDLQHITSIQTHLKMIETLLKQHILKEDPIITEEIFYQDIVKIYLQQKINLYESGLSSIIQNCTSVSWVKFSKDNQKFLDSCKIDFVLETGSIFEDLAKEY